MHNHRDQFMIRHTAHLDMVMPTLCESQLRAWALDVLHISLAVSLTALSAELLAAGWEVWQRVEPNPA